LQPKIIKTYLMKRYSGLLLLMFAAVSLCTSCLKSDADEVTLYDDVAITNFYITSALSTVHTTASDGSDSTYATTDKTVANYPFVIDQLKGEIYNTDSLPSGINGAKMLCSWTGRNNAQAYLKSVTGDSVKYLLTTDTVDFSVPRMLYVISSSGQYSREYTVKVNIHKEDGDVFGWENKAAADAGIAGLEGMKALELNGQIYVFGVADGTTVGYVADKADGRRWTALQSNLNMVFAADAYKSTIIYDGAVYLKSGSSIFRAADGKTWEHVADADLKQLLGASTAEMYALSNDGRIMVSEDKGMSWKADSLYSDATMLPAEDISCSSVPFKYADGTDYVVLAGNRAATNASDAAAVVWRKQVDNSSATVAGKWTCMSDLAAAHQAPRLKNLTVVAYGDVYLAFGLEGIGANTDAAFEHIYCSRDMGITWKKNAVYVYPAALDTSATSMTVLVDSSYNIWLFCGGTGQIWKGRLNKMGWH